MCQLLLAREGSGSLASGGSPVFHACSSTTRPSAHPSAVPSVVSRAYVDSVDNRNMQQTTLIRDTTHLVVSLHVEDGVYRLSCLNTAAAASGQAKVVLVRFGQ